METQGKREKTALGGVLMHAFSLWQVLRHAEGDRWKGRPLVLGACSAPKKLCYQAKEGSLYAKGLDF